jgi:hypothetical protein
MSTLKPKPPSRKPANASTNGQTKLPPLTKPASPYPGYMTDEWFEYGMAVLRSTTREEFRADLVRFGITDKKGNYTAPYRGQ